LGGVALRRWCGSGGCSKSCGTTRDETNHWNLLFQAARLRHRLAGAGAYWPFSRFLQVGGGSGFRGLHGQPDDVGGVVVAAGGGGGGAGFVTAGGGVVFFGDCAVLGAGLLGLLDGVSLEGDGLSVELGVVLGVDDVQLDSGVLSGSSSATPWIAIPTSTPSNADPSTAEPPAAHSARTAVLLTCSRLEVGRSRSDYRVDQSQENVRLHALSAP
jgi:hypothetical protein